MTGNAESSGSTGTIVADADAALELVAEFDRPAVAIVKHANPCGVAEGDDLAVAYKRALACDPVSAAATTVNVTLTVWLTSPLEIETEP